MIKIKDKKLLFIYRNPLFIFVKFKTDNKELKKIVHALNIKEKRKRYQYVYKEAIKEINKYYNSDLCNFKSGQCIVQRKSNSKKVNGCCRTCPLVTDKGCPSENISCKLIYCKEALKNLKILKLRDITILKVLPIIKRLILKSDFFITKEEILLDLNRSIFTYSIKTIIRQIKRAIH